MGSVERYSSGQRRRIYVLSSPSNGEIRWSLVVRCISWRQRKNRYTPFHISGRESDLLSTGTNAGRSYGTSSLLLGKDRSVLKSACDLVVDASLAPGQDYALPIEAVTQNRIRLQPDRAHSFTWNFCSMLIWSFKEGFGYRWCTSIRFEDLIAKKSLTISCPHNDQREAPFRFQAWAQSDSNEPGTRWNYLRISVHTYH